MTPSSNSTPYESLSVEDFAHRRTTSRETMQLIDVREPGEVQVASLDDFVNLPLSEFDRWAETIHSQFDADQETIVMCHHGVRSAQMCMWLAQQGFTKLKNLAGGIDAYSLQVDPSVPRY